MIGLANGTTHYQKPTTVHSAAQIAGNFIAFFEPSRLPNRLGDPHALFELALLTSPPTPSRDGFVEMVGGGYQRQPVRLVAAGPHTLANEVAIDFGPITDSWPVATHVCLFDDHNDIVVYTKPVRMSQAHGLGSTVHFNPYQVSVRLSDVA